MDVDVNLELMYRFLDVDEDEPLCQLFDAARTVSRSLATLVISVAKHNGHRLGSGAEDELRRARARIDDYAEVGAVISATTNARSVKGASLAKLYPESLLRPYNDLDLVTADEADLWAVVRKVRALRPVDYIDVSLLGWPDPGVVATVSWPTSEDLLDIPFGVEVSTLGFCGDFGAVPLRRPLPEDQAVTDLLSIAEERFQRPFHARDVIDLGMWSGQPGLDLANVAAACDAWRLAPEVAELLAYAESYIPLDRLAPLRDSLPPLVAEERRRRAEWLPPAVPADLQPTDARLATGKPSYGMHLRWASGREDQHMAIRHDHDDITLLLTPVADYLMVSQELVSEEMFERAQQVLDWLAPNLT